jgi:hypothetical protein
MTNELLSNLALDSDPATDTTTDAGDAATPKPTIKRRRKRMPISGFCEAGNHGLCPHLMRAHRFTDKGTELRELVCPCRCHPKSDLS